MKRALFCVLLLLLLAIPASADASRPILFPPTQVERFELAVGWNYVGWAGNPTSVEKLDLHGIEIMYEYVPLDDAVWRVWDRQRPSFLNSLTELRPYRAYIIRVNQDGVLWPPLMR